MKINPLLNCLGNRNDISSTMYLNLNAHYSVLQVIYWAEHFPFEVLCVFV